MLVGLDAYRKGLVLREDEGGRHEVAFTQPTHLYLLAAKRYHAADECTANNYIGILARHSCQCIHVFAVVVYQLVGCTSHGHFYLQLAHPSKDRAEREG